MQNMWKVIKRRWNYLVAKLSGRFEENADPKVQLEQAMAEAQEQHRRLVEQAASVIANQKQTELQLNRSMQELEKISSSTRQALSMADEAARRGDTAKAAEYNQTAEAFANRLIMAEKRADDLKTMSLQSTQAAQQAKAAVQQNANLLQQKLSERQKLLSQLDQARMQEQLNTAMATLSQTVGQDVPTFDEVRTKIEAQYAKALGTAELSNQGVEARMLEIEQASVNSEAQTRLAEMRSQMGLPPGGAGGAAALGPGSGQDQSAGQPGVNQLGAGAPVGAPAANDQSSTDQPAFPGQPVPGQPIPGQAIPGQPNPGQQVAGAATPEPAAPSDG
jgi:phage shock protein A